MITWVEGTDWYEALSDCKIELIKQGQEDLLH